jgi:hypothetical protein
MTRLEAVLRDLCQILATRQQEFALVGGLAVSARAEPRFTRDLDLAVVAGDNLAAEAIVHQCPFRLAYRIHSRKVELQVARLPFETAPSWPLRPHLGVGSILSRKDIGLGSYTADTSDF